MFRTLFLIVLLTASSLMAAPGDIIHSFPSPSHFPTGMAFDGTNLWTVDTKTDSLYSIDPANGKVIRTLAAPSWRPRGLAWDGNNLWVVDDDEGYNLICYDIHSKTRVKIIPSPIIKPTGLAWDGRNLWLADNNSINMVSSDDGRILKSFSAPGPGATGLAYDGNYLWSADRIHDRIYMISPVNGDVIIILNSPAPYPWGMAFINGNLFNVDYQTDRIYEVVADDGVTEAEYGPQRENVTYTHEIRNHGPEDLKSLDIYLAIPQSSDHQRLETDPLFYATVTPQYVTDQWGQPFALFHYDDVKPDERIQASYNVTAEFYETRYFIRPEKVESDIPDDISDEYLGNQSVFNTRSPIVRKAVEQAVGDENNPYWKARKIYKWEINHLTYELDDKWETAPEVIQHGAGSCSEYSFVFIAMCRAAGIPARFAGAIAMRGDLASEDDVFHRWCEIYLAPYGWIPVDPSGGDRASSEHQAEMFGGVEAGYLITTEGAGSKYIGWAYNSGYSWKSDGNSSVVSKSLGQWVPAESTAALSQLCPQGGQYCRPEKSPQ